MTAAVGTTSQRITMADALLKEGVISADQHRAALHEYERNKRSIVRILTEMGALDEQARIDFLRRRTNCHVVSLKDVVPRADVAGFMTRELCRRNHVVPLRLDEGSVLVAMEDPTDVRLITDLEKIFGRGVKPVLATSREINETIEKLSEAPPSTAAAEPGTGLRVVSSLTQLLMTLGPMGLSYWFIFYTAFGQQWYGSFNFQQFETAVVLMVTWGSWAAISYYLHDLIFGSPQTS